MSRPVCILAGGLSRAGKDTFAGYVRAYGGNVATVQFSRPLKDACNMAFSHLGLPGRFDNDEFKSKPENRAVLVSVGEAARAENPAIFAMLAAHHALQLIASGWNVVISDWRYTNEARIVKDTLSPVADVKTVIVIKENSPAANDVESKTVGRLFEDFPESDFVCAAPGDLECIRKRAKEICEKYGIMQ